MRREDEAEEEEEANVEEAVAAVLASDVIKKDTWLEIAQTLIRDKEVGEAEDLAEEVHASNAVKKVTSPESVQTKAPEEAMKAEVVAEAEEEATVVVEEEETEVAAEHATSVTKRATSPENAPTTKETEEPTNDREGMMAILSEEMTTATPMTGTEEIRTTTMKLGMATNSHKEIGELATKTRTTAQVDGETDAQEYKLDALIEVSLIS